MNKAIKKTLVLLLSAVMILGSVMPSFAAQPKVVSFSTEDVTFETATAQDVTKVAAPGHYEGFYAEKDLYKGKEVHNVYVEVPAAYEGAFQSDLYASTHDFIKIAVTYVLPADANGKVTVPKGGWPALIQCCRYDTAPSSTTGRYNGADSYFTEHGYVVMRVDLRGMGASGGIAKGFGTRENGLDVKYIIENWLPKQEWYSGKCAMYGSSNQGVIGNTTAVTVPEGLEGYQVGVASIDYYSQKYNNGVSIANNGWGSIPNLTNPWSVGTFTNELAKPASPENPRGIFRTYSIPVFDENGDPVMVQGMFGLSQKTETHTAIDEDGNIEPYEEWIKHPTAQFVDSDPRGLVAYQHYVQQQIYNEMFFTWMTVPNMYRDSKDADGWEVYEDIVLFEEIGNVVDNGIETYNYGGYQDIASTAQLAVATLTDGHIVLSNGNHGGAMTGGDFSKSVLGFSSNEDFVRYFDHLLKGVDNGFESAPFAYYYLLDTSNPAIATYNPAHYAEQIPLANTIKTDYYLNSDVLVASDDVAYLNNNNGTLSTVKPSGDSYVEYQITQDVLKLNGGINFDITGMSNGPVGTPDLSKSIDERSVSFTTEPFEESFTYLGNGTMDIWASSDNADDFDLIGMLELVREDGSSHYLSRGTIRASHREGVEAGSDQAKLWDTIGLTAYEHNSLEASVQKMLEEGLEDPVLLKFNLELAGVKINAGDRLRVTLFNVTHRSGAATQSYMYYDEAGNLLPDEQLPKIKYYTAGDHASKMTLPVYTSVDNTLNGTITFADGSYCGPATMYLLDENYYVQYNGDWLKLPKIVETVSMFGKMKSANPQIKYVVDSNGVANFYNAGFTFRPEGEIIADAQAQIYKGEDSATTYAFPATFEGYQGQLVTVSLGQGDYYGALKDGVVTFKGLQYGKAPLFQAPVEMPDKAADAKVINAFDHGMSTSGAGSADIDCLNLSVYLNPEWDEAKDGPRTVFMWVFGSANSGGAVGSPDWSNFVKKNPGIIVVTPTHRGGLLGSADLSQLEGYNDPKYLDENGENIYRFSNNLARLDILQVLKWINKNIADFGGNPDSVAIGGQSSGGNLCASVMMMPESKDLWDRALLQESFPLDGSLMPLDEAKVVAANTFKTLKVSTMEEFLNLPAASYRSSAPADFGYKALSPVVDDIVIRSNYYDQLLGKDGLWAGKPVLFGCNEGGYDQMYNPGNDAANMVTARGRSIGNLGSMGSIGKTGWYDHSATIGGQYIENVADWIVERFVANENEDYPSRNGNYAAKDLDQDLNLRVPGLLFAEAACQNTNVYYYRLNFNSNSAVTHQRAAHGSENSVISANWTAAAREGVSAAVRQNIGDAMVDIWAAFIQTGDPNGAHIGSGAADVTWKPYTSKGKETLLIGAEDFAMVNGVRNEDTAVTMPIMREYTKLMHIEGIPESSATTNLDTIVSQAAVMPYGLPARATSGVEWKVVSQSSSQMVIRATIKDGICDVENGATEKVYSKGVVTSDFTQDFTVKLTGSSSDSGSGGGYVPVVVTPAKKTSFVDVVDGAYYAKAVEWAVKNNYVLGVTDTHFGPMESCTRAEIVTFLWRMAGKPTVSADISFKDVKAGSYYEKAVKWAVSKGIVNGVTEDTFAPQSSVTRAEAVTFMYRAAGKPGVSGGNKFTDVSSGKFYTKAVNWAVENSIIGGVTKTEFAPNDDCLRAEIVTMMYRIK